MKKKIKKNSKSVSHRNNTKKPFLLPRPPFNKRMEITYGPPQNSIPRGEKGEYQLIYILCIPGKNAFRDVLNIEEIMQSGDSLIYIGKDIEIEMKLSNENGTTDIKVKSGLNGNMAVISLKVDAENFIDAERKSYNFLMPVLSNWSFYYDVAVDFTGYEVLEKATGIKKWSFGLVGEIKSFTNSEFETKNEFRPVLAAYREATNSTNIFYQVLSFYKVWEGVKTLRALRHKKIHGEGNKPVTPEERFPVSIDDLKDVDPWTKHELKEYEGKKYSWVLDQHRSLIRNAVAHLKPTDNVLEPDRYDDVAACERGLLVLKYIVREVLNNELNEYKKL